MGGSIATLTTAWLSWLCDRGKVETTKLFDGAENIPDAWRTWALRGRKSYHEVETALLNVILDVHDHPIIVHIHGSLSTLLDKEYAQAPSLQVVSTMICGVAGLMAFVKKVLPMKREEVDAAWYPFVIWMMVKYPRYHSRLLKLRQQQQQQDAVLMVLPDAAPVPIIAPLPTCAIESMSLSTLASQGDIFGLFDLFEVSPEVKAWAKRKGLWTALFRAFKKVRIGPPKCATLISSVKCDCCPFPLCRPWTLCPIPTSCASWEASIS